MLQGRTALVTGSTSGMGLGIAEAMTAQSANVVLNGFGDRAEIERLRSCLAAKPRVSVRYDGADMSKGESIELMMRTALTTFGSVDLPGYVWTPLVEKPIPDTAKARGITKDQVRHDVLLAWQPTKKFVTVEKDAALAVFLAGDAAASITWSVLPIDGGWTAH